MTRGIKGQAAMEFLMTYGWAILAAVIVIAVLAAFGVFSPSTYVPNQCILAAPLGCNAGTVDTSAVNLEIRNGAGESLSVQSVDVSGCGTYSTVTAMADGDLTTFTVTCTPALTAGDKFQGDIVINYTKSGSALVLTSSGQIVDSV